MAEFVVSEKIALENRKMVVSCLKMLARIISADGVSFMLKDESEEELELVASAEATKEIAEKKLGIRVKVGERVAGRAASEKKPFLIIGDISQNKEFTHLKKYEEISSGLAVPVLKGQKVVGVLNAKKTSAREVLTQRELEIAKIVASVLGEEL